MSTPVVDYVDASGQPYTPPAGNYTHGTRYAYVQKQCRCQLCRAWNAQSQQASRAKRKAQLTTATTEAVEATSSVAA